MNISQEIVNELVLSLPDNLTAEDPPAQIREDGCAPAYRWGARLLLFPSREEDVERLERAHRWTAEATALLRDAHIAVPTPRYRGEPSKIWPRPWYVTDAVGGRPLHTVEPDGRGRIARDLAVAVAVLHVDAPPSAPDIPPLSPWDAKIERDAVRGADRLTEMIELGARVPPWQGNPVWCHGNLNPATIAVHDTSLSGLIDFGALGRGDPAVDYAAFFLCFTPSQREDARVILRTIGAPDDDDLWIRARAWAARTALTLVASHQPDMSAVGRQACELVLESA